ncbi:tyrosine-type recombinase/integrase [Brachybacterium kimchii]|uniref:Site-specific integrase n=1 Tax=Brachybacterium kimchii TaxID=2942909 RepID=A0ABY4NB86_9MICO|nr:site-specific integrase [Brachybacterium kimchii]UQN30698.1 site-specific integrase [Brachybacterium kimchii]
MPFYTATTHPQVKKYEDRRTGATRYLVRYRTDEHKLTMKRGFRTLRDAKDFLVEQESTKADGSFIAQAAGRVTVGEIARPWLDHKKAVSSKTYGSTLESSWRTHVEERWAEVRISAVKSTAVRDWVAELADEKSASVVIRAYGILAGVLDDAVADRRLARNPARGVALPKKVSAPRRYLEPAEVEVVAETVWAPRRMLFLVLAWTGLRWGEAVALRVRDVNQVRRRLLVQRAVEYTAGEWHVTDTKGHQRRSVALPKSVYTEFAQHIRDLPDPDDLGPDRLLFPPARTKGGYMIAPRKSAERPDRPGKVRVDWLEAALTTVGLPYMSPHELRHTAASLAVSAGANVKSLQRMLGHKSAALTLDTYADLFDSDLDDVAERLDGVRQSARREHNLSTTASDSAPSGETPATSSVQLIAETGTSG